MHTEISQRRQTVHGSPRAGGSYTIELIIADRVAPYLDEEVKARLTTYLVRSRRLGNQIPHIGQREVEDARVAQPSSVHERALSLLRYIAKITTRVGQDVQVYDAIDGALARSESIDHSEVEYLADYLSKMDLLITSTNANPLHYCVVSVEGYSHLEDARHASRPNQAFVAMWFDASMSELYDEGIRPAIEDAGYEACRIDQRDSIGKIDDEIVREIRRSRFMVADFTQGEEGNRGSVYYEAGLARGLGMPIISTCREDQMKILAFDTRQYAHIGWNDLEALRKELADRIGASIGEGSHSGEDHE